MVRELAKVSLSRPIKAMSESEQAQLLGGLQRIVNDLEKGHGRDLGVFFVTYYEPSSKTDFSAGRKAK